MVARTVTGDELRRSPNGSGGQQTAEWDDGCAIVKTTASKTAKKSSSSSSHAAKASGLFHTVTASTPRAKRMARVYPHSTATGVVQQRQTAPAPSFKTSGGLATPDQELRSRQEAGDDAEAMATWCSTTRPRCDSSHSSRARSSYHDDDFSDSDCESESELVLTLTPTRIVRQSSIGSSSSNAPTFQHRAAARDPTAATAAAGWRGTATAGGLVQEDILSRIATLKALCDQGFISSDEYERRKSAIIDELTFSQDSDGGNGEHDGDEDDFTDYGDDYDNDYEDDSAGTTLLATQVTVTELPATQPSRMGFGRPAEGLPLIVPHAPNFYDIRSETATKHVFDYATRQWSSAQVQVALDETPFSKGSLRVVYHLLDLTNDGADGELVVSKGRRASSSSSAPKRMNYVAKLAIDPDEDPQTYFRDTELQAHCAHYAQMYNSYNPPKRVEFIEAWVLELTERNGALCAVEPYIPGEYRKHNNNFGSVSDDERNTPQAFSHFTYEASNHKLLAVDIQGVGDLYTDPQIHTLNGNDFGKGNLGALGFQKFLSSHRCNSICRYLKLPSVNPKDRHADSGTLPIQELMNRDRVRPMQFDSTHYYENAPMLQKYITQCRELEGKGSLSPPPAAPRGVGNRTNQQQQQYAQQTQHGLVMRILSRLFCCGAQ